MKSEGHELPSSTESERAYLGALLLSGGAHHLASTLLTAGDFYLDSHRKIFVAIVALREKGITPDLVTLSEQLMQRNELEIVGGGGYISQLTDGLPRLENLEHYEKVIRDKSVLRRAIFAAQEVAKRAHECPEDILAFLKWARESLPAPSGNGKTGPVPLIAVTAEELLSREIKPREMLLDPLIPEQGLVMVYSSRGFGKTYIALGMAVAVAGGGSFLHWKAPRPRRVLYVDGELPAKTLQERIAMIVAGADVEPAPGMLRIVTPDFQERPMPDLATAEGQAALEPLLVGVDLLVLDNLSALCRSGKENEGESWLPVQGWTLDLRRRGMSVQFVHHAGKGGAQRGTSRREDLLDTVITLKRPAEYSPNEGLRCEVHFEKTRAMFGDAAKPFEVKLDMGGGGAAVWTIRDMEEVKQSQAAKLFSSGATVRDVAEELRISKSAAGRLRDKWDGKRDRPDSVPVSPSRKVGQRDKKPNGGEHVASH